MIWVNAIWRSGSTYVWNKFRQTGQYHCYLEPFHEEMATLSAARDQEILASGLPALLRHPRVDQPYFAEYPVRPGGGVPGYLKRFGYERCMLSGNDRDDELEAYIASLAAYARERGKMAMFQPNRALLRSDWLCGRLGFTHVFLLRHPWKVWRSMMSYENLYFPGAILNTIGQNRELSCFAPIVSRYSIPRISHPDSRVELAECSAFAREHRDILDSIFFYFYLLTTLYNLKCCDVALDLNRIGSDANARQRAEERLSRDGIGISLADCAPPRQEFSPAEMSCQRRIEDDVSEMLAGVGSTVQISRERLAELSLDLDGSIAALCGRFVG
jgi:hypothetical protein